GRTRRRANPRRPTTRTCSTCCSTGRPTRRRASGSSPTIPRSSMAFRVALVGLGMAVTPHAKSLLDLKDRVEVAYAFSPSVERRKKFREKFPAFPLCEKLETILDDKSVGAVLILTPPNTHLELVERFAIAGKHVLLEKPLEVSLERAERLVAAASKVKL